MSQKADKEAQGSGVSDDEWQARLSPEAYAVTRCAGTEPAFTGRYWNEKTAGMYKCVCCGTDLFDSETKYDSGTGWPAFYSPVSEEALKTEEDRSHFMIRTEVLCANCDAHLGHAFPGGPEPTGLSFCINSAALDLEKK